MEEVAHRLKAFRQSHQPPLTATQAAELVPVSRSTWFRWESGVRSIDQELLPRMQELTGIAAKDLRPDLARHFEAAE